MAIFEKTVVRQDKESVSIKNSSSNKQADVEIKCEGWFFIGEDKSFIKRFYKTKESTSKDIREEHIG